MRAVDIIIKKRDHQPLNAEEIDFFVQGLTRGDIPDYQVAAWAMAVLLNGMTPEEVTALTMAMVRSGKTLDLSGVVPFAIDKHSTGGVGDKTTLVVGPVVAACGLPVGKMSGRGLGFSGGTLDKMESIPGFKVDMTEEAFKEQLKTVGFVLSGQTTTLAPADGILYALRDVTGTVPSIPLIASSIMCKKIASGAQGIVLDVKVGKGAFMETLAEARALSQTMVDIARRVDRTAVALISDMNQPLGCAVGNALELREALDTLHGQGPADFQEHCLTLAAEMLLMGKIVLTLEAGREMALSRIANGAAYEKFRQMVAAQGGDTRVLDEPDRLARAPVIKTVSATQAGYIQEVNARVVGETCVALGAGRMKKGDPIDHSVGLVVHVKVGDQASQGDPLFTVHAASENSCAEAVERVQAAIRFNENPVEPLPLFYEIIR